MQHSKQVDVDHYEFERYMSKARWNSVWHQLDEVKKLNPNNVLEIGPGPGVFKSVATQFGLEVETLDVDVALKPDCVASVTSLPFENESFDVVCAFQMLEHLPYEVALNAFEEIVRVSRKGVVISLPDAKRLWTLRLPVPFYGPCDIFLPRPQVRKKHDFDGQHYWEINKLGYHLSRIIVDFSRFIQLAKTYRVFELPYHRFFVFHKHPTEEL